MSSCLSCRAGRLRRRKVQVHVPCWGHCLVKKSRSALYFDVLHLWHLNDSSRRQSSPHKWQYSPCKLSLPTRPAYLLLQVCWRGLRTWDTWHSSWWDPTAVSQSAADLENDKGPGYKSMVRKHMHPHQKKSLPQTISLKLGAPHLKVRRGT